MDIVTLIIYGWLVFASFLSVYWGFIILFTRDWTKTIFTAKFYKTPLDLQATKGGSLKFQNTKWNEDGVLINEDGNPIQEFKGLRKEDIKNLYFSGGGVRCLIRPENSITPLDHMFNTNEINHNWLKGWAITQKLRIELGKKLSKEKARKFPILWIVLIILMMVGAYISYVMFW